MRRDRGVTLIEILLAAVVVGAGLSVVLSAITTSIRVEVYADNKVKAARLLDLQIGRLQGGVLPLQSQGGDFAADGEPDFNFTVLQEDTQQQYLEQITVAVQWLEHGEQRDLDAVFFYYADPNAGNTGASGTASGSLMGSNGGGPKGSLMGGGNGGNSGSLMGSGGGGGGSLIGNSGGGGGGGASGSLLGGGGGGAP